MFDSCLSESIAGGVRGNFNDLLEMFSPTVCWTGLILNLSGVFVHALQMNS